MAGGLRRGLPSMSCLFVFTVFTLSIAPTVTLPRNELKALGLSRLGPKHYRAMRPHSETWEQFIYEVHAFRQ